MNASQYPVTHRIDGAGRLVETRLRAYIPEIYFDMFNLPTLARGNPCNATQWGDMQRDCYACSQVISGAACACTAHGVKRVETIVTP